MLMNKNELLELMKECKDEMNEKNWYQTMLLCDFSFIDSIEIIINKNDKLEKENEELKKENDELIDNILKLQNKLNYYNRKLSEILEY